MRGNCPTKFYEFQRWCKAVHMVGGHWESCIGDVEACRITEKLCSARNCPIWRKLRRAEAKAANSTCDHRFSIHGNFVRCITCKKEFPTITEL